MRYFRQICSRYLVVKVFITFHFRYPIRNGYTFQEKAQCVSRFVETKSDPQTRRNFRTRYGRDPPSRPSILVHGTRNLWRQGQCSTKGGVEGIVYRLDVPRATNGAHIEVY